MIVNARLTEKVICCLLFAVQLWAWAMPARCNAQERDSIKLLITSHTLQDTAKVKLLIELGLVLEDYNPDSVRIVAQQGLKLSENINYEYGKAKCMQQLAYVCMMKNRYDSSLPLFEQSALLFNKLGNNAEMCNVFHQIAFIYYHLGKYQLSITYNSKIVEIAEKDKDFKTEQRALNDIGGMYLDMANYATALNYYLKALKINEQIKFKQGLGVSYRNLADVYSWLGEIKKANEYINKSLSMYEGMNSAMATINNYISVGVIYGQMKDYTNALSYFIKAEQLSDSVHSLVMKNVCLINMADVYFELGSYDTALNVFGDCITLSEKVKDKNGLGYAHKGAGSILIKKGKINEGIHHMLIAYNILREIGINSAAATAAQELSHAYELLNDYSNALLYETRYSQMKDSLYGEKNDKKIQQLQFDYELAKKESEIKLLNKNKIIDQSKSDKQRIILWTLLCGFSFLVFFSMVLYRGRRKEKINKDRIYLQKEELGRQARRLEELNRFKDKTFSVLSHDLRGPIDAFSSIMTMLDQNLISLDDFALLKPEINKQLLSLNLLLENLLQWARSYMQGNSSARPVTININDISARNINLANEIAKRKRITIDNRIPPMLTAFADGGQMDIMLRNLLMNALKFTSTGGRITLAAEINAGNIEISVADNGVGMTKEQMSKLFAPKPDNTTYGTDGEKGTGLGLLLCYEFARANNGTISVASEEGKGTTFTIVIPAAAGTTTHQIHSA